MKGASLVHKMYLAINNDKWKELEAILWKAEALKLAVNKHCNGEGVFMHSLCMFTTNKKKIFTTTTVQHTRGNNILHLHILLDTIR